MDGKWSIKVAARVKKRKEENKNGPK